MKKLIVLSMLFVCSIAYADNSVRIKELKDQNEQLGVQIQQAQNFINQSQLTVIKNIGIVEELQKQDTPKESKEATNG